MSEIKTCVDSIFEELVSLHNGKIVFNEDVMKSGAAGLTAIALEYLSK